jgi:hypothetical protein
VTATWLLLAIGLLTAAGDAMAIERLSYRTIEQDGDVELRRIESHVVAETFVEGGSVAWSSTSTARTESRPRSQ